MSVGVRHLMCLQSRTLAVLFGGPLTAAVLIGRRVHERRHPHTRGPDDQ